MHHPAPIAKRPCNNCPFRSDGAGVELQPGRIEGIFEHLLADDHHTFVCHKTLDGVRQTCAGAVGLMAKAGRLPIIARLALATGHISGHDIQRSAALVIDPPHRCADLPDDELA